MIKKNIRKLQLSRQTIRVISNANLSKIAGGLTGQPEGTTTTLHEGTGPFPSHGPCGGTIIVV